jgi:hypothetical protein
VIHEHPILTPLYGIGYPAILGASAAGVVGAVIFAAAAIFVIVNYWRVECLTRR